MDFKNYFTENEKPLDNLINDGGFCGIFRKIGCIGDSLSSGEFESKDKVGNTGYHDMFEYSWGQYMARTIGNTVYNFSAGGMSADRYLDGFADSKGYWSKDLACQAYIMALGVNDISIMLGNGYEFGDISDIDFDDYKNNKKTFAGYYAAVIQRYREIQPDSFFFLMTIPKSDPTPADRSALEDKHQALLYQLAECFPRTYVLDFRKYAPVYDRDFQKKFYLSTHMNPMGYILTSKMTISYIDYIIRHNMRAFNQVQFIGTPLKNELDV